MGILHKKMKLFYFIAASAMAKKKDKAPKEPVTLSGDDKKAFAMVGSPSKAMESMYRDEMVGYGKNDWNVFADGVIRWVGKMEKDFGKKSRKMRKRILDKPNEIR